MPAIKVNDHNFELEVIKSKIPVLVDFAADWCGPCKMMSPMLEEISEELEGKMKVVKINVDDAQELAAAYNVMSIPNLLIFKEGEVADQMTGAMAKEQLMSQLKAYLQ